MGMIVSFGPSFFFVRCFWKVIMVTDWLIYRARHAVPCGR